MDRTTEIKNNLISRIKASEDLNFLKALETLFDASESSLFKLNSEQEESIAIGRKEINNNQVFNNEMVISEMRQWLESK
tara:strand:- start:237 stop:473 length:237 start_codon:yes stop_codon:yes gene_type:complete